MIDEVLKSYKRWVIQIAREFNIKNNEIKDIIIIFAIIICQIKKAHP